MKTFYILRHNSGNSYLKLPTAKTPGKKYTRDVQHAFRANTKEEALSWKQYVSVSLAWDVIAVKFDPKQGKVIDETAC